MISSSVGSLLSFHFRKSFDGYDAQRRASVAKALSDLACPLAHGESPECSRPTGQDMLLLSTYKIAIRQVVRGRTDEVTAAVQKLGNRALCLAVRHHSIELGLKEVDELVIGLCQSLVHSDRAVRLSAGLVLTSDRVYFSLTTSWVKLAKSSWRSCHFIIASDKSHIFVQSGFLISFMNY